MRRGGISGREIAGAEMRPGDLMLFCWRPDLPAKHAGILSASDRFIHAYEQAAVIESGARAFLAAADRRGFSFSRRGLTSMATILLQAAGAALGGVFGPVGAVLGRAAGALAGSVVDRSIINGMTTIPARASAMRAYRAPRRDGDYAGLRNGADRRHADLGDAVRRGGACRAAGRQGERAAGRDLPILCQFRARYLRGRDRLRAAGLGRRARDRADRDRDAALSRHTGPVARSADRGQAGRRQGASLPRALPMRCSNAFRWTVTATAFR